MWRLIWCLSWKLESEGNPPPASAASQSAASASTATHSASGSLLAGIVRCDTEERGFLPWSATTTPADHPGFSGPVPPVPLATLATRLPRTSPSTPGPDLRGTDWEYLNFSLPKG